LSISDLLDATVDDAVRFLGAFPDSKPARRALGKLALLGEVGLGYLRLGQPLNTLSGGESQRLKLVSHLATTAAVASATAGGSSSPSSRRRAAAEADPEGGGKPTLFLLDEPTTGLHLEDVRILLMVFQRLVDQGHSVILIEHHMEFLDDLVDGVVVFDAGKCIYQGSMQGMYKAPTVVAAYLGKVAEGAAPVAAEVNHA